MYHIIVDDFYVDTIYCISPIINVFDNKYQYFTDFDSLLVCCIDDYWDDMIFSLFVKQATTRGDCCD